MNKRGIALIICYMIIVILGILGVAFLTHNIAERSFATKYFDSTQAFWLAEAGVNKAIVQLRANYGDVAAIPATFLGPEGQYSAAIVAPDSINRTVTGYGYIPSQASAVKIQRVVEAKMIKYIPPNFYGNAVYSAGDVSIGSNCVVNGNAFSGGTVTGSVTAPSTVTQNDADLHAKGLALLNFDELKQESIDQGWYNPSTGETTYPTVSFWYEAPSPINPTGTPNVVFVNGDFTLVGGKQVVKGFIVVGGNTVYDAEIGGNARIDGCLYTRGDIWMHGGGGNVINVDGGLWAGGTVTMNGNEQINFVPPAGHGTEYMASIATLVTIMADVHVISWREIQNSY